MSNPEPIQSILPRVMAHLRGPMTWTDEMLAERQNRYTPAETELDQDRAELYRLARLGKAVEAVGAHDLWEALFAGNLEEWDTAIGQEKRAAINALISHPSWRTE